MPLERSRAECQIQEFLIPKPALPQVAFQEESGGLQREGEWGMEEGKEVRREGRENEN